MTMMNKQRWGDLEDDDYEVENNCLLPPKQVNGPDINGVKTMVWYKFDDHGHKVKITTKTRVVVKAFSKKVVECRSWAKFGDAVNDDGTGGGFTTVSIEEVELDHPGNSKEKDTKVISNNTKICRNCQQKGDHWTAACPYKDLVQSSDVSMDNPAATTLTTPKKYVPPRPTTTDQRHRNDDNVVRVNNLSEDTKEADLLDLFEPFGRVVRAFVATDRSTKMSRGFGFVTFARREDAQRAILKLDGYGYDNLILKVEWSAPKA